MRSMHFHQIILQCTNNWSCAPVMNRLVVICRCTTLVPRPVENRRGTRVGQHQKWMISSRSVPLLLTGHHCNPPPLSPEAGGVELRTAAAALALDSRCGQTGGHARHFFKNGVAPRHCCAAATPLRKCQKVKIFDGVGQLFCPTIAAGRRQSCALLFSD